MNSPLPPEIETSGPARQHIVRVRRRYNQWVANQTFEDYALRFTAKSARKWSAARVANTALGSISFLALEAIGGAITLNYGFSNAVTAIMVVGVLIFLMGLPITAYASKYGVDIDLLTRGAGFGYLGSTITSLIYASFTFLFFALEAAIMSLALEMCFGIPMPIGYVISAIVVIPLVTHGITFISRFQLWTQPIWIILHLLPFVFIGLQSFDSAHQWASFEGRMSAPGEGFNLMLFGAAASVVFALVAQIGEQVDFLRFLPSRDEIKKSTWWLAMLSAGPGWIVPGALKLLAGSFLAVLALHHGVPIEHAAEPTQMYLVGFSYVLNSPEAMISLTGIFVILSQLKINVTNAYAGSLAWSNFFSRLTHSHPGRVVWLVFNVAIALLLMELGIYRALEQTLGLYSIVAVAWVSALVADLVINKPLGLSPPHIEFKRAYLYDINPVGVGAMISATIVAIIALTGAFGLLIQSVAPFVAMATAFVVAPLIAYATGGKYYLARKAPAELQGAGTKRCCICEHHFEGEDMAYCPAYAGPICSLCCSLDARCHDSCKTEARFADQARALLHALLPKGVIEPTNSRIGHYLGVLLLLASVIAAVLMLIYIEESAQLKLTDHIILQAAFFKVFFVLLIIVGVATWLFVLAQESRRVAQEESNRQTTLLMREIEAHKITDAALQRAKEVAEAANQAKSRYVVGISHELRTPLNSIMGYAQLLERDATIPPRRRDAIRLVRRSAEHLSGLIDGLLDISRIEAGRLHLNRNEVRTRDFMEQVVDMFQLPARAKQIDFVYDQATPLPSVVYTDEKRLRQILINLVSNAIKFTRAGQVTLRVRYRSQVAEFEVHDTGSGIPQEDLDRIFEPFERGSHHGAVIPGMGLGLTITKLLTEIMGGDITVSSSIGQGSTFKVRLLLSAAPQSGPETPREVRITGYEGARRTVIVADDEPAHRELMHEILVPLGFVLLSARDGEECLNLAVHCEPDLFLLDISMPGISGWEVARRLRKMGHDRAPIIMVSANAGERSQLRDPEDDDYDYDYIIKPIIISQLLERIGSRLQLEWIESTMLLPNHVNGALSFMDIPDRRHIEELLQLGRIGYVNGIREKLDEIEALDPSYETFVTRLRMCIRDFDVKQYMSTLEELPLHGV